MKVTIYTINDCKFSQAEKDYLKTNNIAFEEKNVEQNRDFLTEMLGISENFAGTPVTKIEKDDGTSNVLKGFTQEEFDKELGLATVPDVLTATPPMPPKDIDVPPPAAGTPDPAPGDMSPISLSDSPTTPPVDTQTMPISLSDNPTPPQPIDTSLASNATSATPPAIPSESVVEPIVQPAPDATAAPSEPATDQLNSVLENLQNQVNTATPPKDDPASAPKI